VLRQEHIAERIVEFQIPSGPVDDSSDVLGNPVTAGQPQGLRAGSLNDATDRKDVGIRRTDIEQGSGVGDNELVDFRGREIERARPEVAVVQHAEIDRGEEHRAHVDVTRGGGNRPALPRASDYRSEG
jgi:hypothetical protein